jgi:DNA replication protein DnaC
VKKQVIEHLGQLDFLHAKQNVILLGPPGTGKTHISIGECRRNRVSVAERTSHAYENSQQDR